MSWGFQNKHPNIYKQVWILNGFICLPQHKLTKSTLVFVGLHTGGNGTEAGRSNVPIAPASDGGSLCDEWTPLEGSTEAIMAKHFEVKVNVFLGSTYQFTQEIQQTKQAVED